ncbi:MAG: hypothetical protein AAF960_20490 [Bacteroidota bacterium]
MKIQLVLPLVIIVTSIFWSCQSEEEAEVFDIDGKSKLVLKNKLDDSIRLKIENWHQIPWKSQIVDTIIEKDGFVEFDLITQGYSYYKA